jgi:uncharacterized membrane protein YfcA
MWEQYKKTFASMQVAIAGVTLAVFFGLGRLWFVTATFFAVMQLGSLLGAFWGARLKRRLLPFVS